MAPRSHIFGTAVTYSGGCWRVAGSGVPVEEAVMRCPLCQALRTDPDPCVGVLPGVAAACCGHGVGCGYVMFTDGRVLRGDAAAEFLGES